MSMSGANFLSQAGQNFQSGAGSILGGFFNNSGEPYKKAGESFEQSQNQGSAYQAPYYQTGVAAIPQLQNWLNSMKNPSEFINNLMKQYQESPYAKFETNQGVRAANNAASANGLIGSTPLGQENAQFAENVSSQDMQNWLAKVLGINTEYGAGQAGLVSGGQNSANALTQLIQSLAGNKGAAAYGEQAGQNQDRSDIISGILKLLT